MLSNILRGKVVEALSKVLPENIIAEIKDIETPKNEDLGDAAFPVFQIARAEKKNPKIIATELVAKLNEIDFSEFSSVVADGGYVNFIFAPGYLFKTLLSQVAQESDRFGSNNECAGDKVMIEFSGLNTHKEVHVGHLRNFSIGDCLVRLYRASGCFTVAADYTNDCGLHVATCLWAMKKFHPGYLPSIEERGKWLGEVYAQGFLAREENMENRQQVNVILKALEEKDPEWMPLFLETREWSLKRFNKIYQELGIRFDDSFYESDVKEEGKKVVSALIEQGIARKSEGAIIVDLSEYGLDVLVILKSDGTGIYATSDLALAYEKFRRYEIKRAIYITDTRQSFYFKQLFKTLELAGFKKELVHIGYEFVRLPEGTMSSRSGRIIAYEDFITDVTNSANEQTQVRHSDWSPERVKEVSKKIAIGSIKFEMLKHDPGKVITFSIKDALAFDGFTSPYVQYTYARIKSIFRKNASTSPHTAGFGGTVDVSLLKEEEERKIVLKLLSFSDVIKDARNNHNCSAITRYAFDLGKLFATFYEKHPVLTAPAGTKEARLELCSVIAMVIKNCLDLLGIEVVEEM